MVFEGMESFEVTVLMVCKPVIAIPFVVPLLVSLVAPLYERV